jgi:hypothetical protein
MSMRPVLMRASLLVLATLFSLGCSAQSFRAYLASYGNDSNPCTVTAPCRLLPAALNVVADGGEVWMLDSANYNSGTVNVAKSVSILAVPGQVASVVAFAGGPAINIATVGVTVALRNIVIPNNVTNPGTYGVVMTSGALLSVEECVFANLPKAAIYVHDTTAVVAVKNAVFRNLGDYALHAENGPEVTITTSHIFSTSGVLSASSTASTTSVTVSDSTIANSIEGVFAYASSAGAIAKATLTRSTATSTAYALDAETSGAGSALVYAANNTIVRSRGWYVSAGAAVFTYGDNHFADISGSGGTMTPTPTQ